MPLFRDFYPVRACRGALVLAVGCLAVVPAAMALGSYAIDGHVLSNVRPSRVTAPCAALTATAGQPVADYGILGMHQFVLTGFLEAYAPDVPDSLFSTGFENCPI